MKPLLSQKLPTHVLVICQFETLLSPHLSARQAVNFELICQMCHKSGSESICSNMCVKFRPHTDRSRKKAKLPPIYETKLELPKMKMRGRIKKTLIAFPVCVCVCRVDIIPFGKVIN